MNPERLRILDLLATNVPATFTVNASALPLVRYCAENHGASV